MTTTAFSTLFQQLVDKILQQNVHDAYVVANELLNAIHFQKDAEYKVPEMSPATYPSDFMSFLDFLLVNFRVLYSDIALYYVLDEFLATITKVILFCPKDLEFGTTTLSHILHVSQLSVQYRRPHLSLLLLEAVICKLRWGDDIRLHMLKILCNLTDISRMHLNDIEAFCKYADSVFAAVKRYLSLPNSDIAGLVDNPLDLQQIFDIFASYSTQLRSRSLYSDSSAVCQTSLKLLDLSKSMYFEIYEKYILLFKSAMADLSLETKDVIAAKASFMWLQDESKKFVDAPDYILKAYIGLSHVYAITGDFVACFEYLCRAIQCWKKSDQKKQVVQLAEAITEFLCSSGDKTKASQLFDLGYECASTETSEYLSGSYLSLVLASLLVGCTPHLHVLQTANSYLDKAVKRLHLLGYRHSQMLYAFLKARCDILIKLCAFSTNEKLQYNELLLTAIYQWSEHCFSYLIDSRLAAVRWPLLLADLFSRLTYIHSIFNYDVEQLGLICEISRHIDGGVAHLCYPDLISADSSIASNGFLRRVLMPQASSHRAAGERCLGDGSVVLEFCESFATVHEHCQLESSAQVAAVALCRGVGADGQAIMYKYTWSALRDLLLERAPSAVPLLTDCRRFSDSLAAVADCLYGALNEHLLYAVDYRHIPHRDAAVSSIRKERAKVLCTEEDAEKAVAALSRFMLTPWAAQLSSCKRLAVVADDSLLRQSLFRRLLAQAECPAAAAHVLFYPSYAAISLAGASTGRPARAAASLQHDRLSLKSTAVVQAHQPAEPRAGRALVDTRYLSTIVTETSGGGDIVAVDFGMFALPYRMPDSGAVFAAIGAPAAGRSSYRLYDGLVWTPPVAAPPPAGAAGVLRPYDMRDELRDACSLFVAPDAAGSCHPLLACTPLLGRHATVALFLRLLQNAALLHVATWMNFNSGWMLFAAEQPCACTSGQLVTQPTCCHMLDASDLASIGASCTLLILSGGWSVAVDRAPLRHLYQIPPAVNSRLVNAFLAAGVSCILICTAPLPGSIMRQFYSEFYRSVRKNKRICECVGEAKDRLGGSISEWNRATMDESGGAGEQRLTCWSDAFLLVGNCCQTLDYAQICHSMLDEQISQVEGSLRASLGYDPLNRVRPDLFRHQTLSDFYEVADALLDYCLDPARSESEVLHVLTDTRMALERGMKHCCEKNAEWAPKGAAVADGGRLGSAACRVAPVRALLRFANLSLLAPPGRLVPSLEAADHLLLLPLFDNDGHLARAAALLRALCDFPLEPSFSAGDGRWRREWLGVLRNSRLLNVSTLSTLRDFWSVVTQLLGNTSLRLTTSDGVHLTVGSASVRLLDGYNAAAIMKLLECAGLVSVGHGVYGLFDTLDNWNRLSALRDFVESLLPEFTDSATYAAARDSAEPQSGCDAAPAEPFVRLETLPDQTCRVVDTWPGDNDAAIMEMGKKCRAVQQQKDEMLVTQLADLHKQLQLQVAVAKAAKGSQSSSTQPAAADAATNKKSKVKPCGWMAANRVPVDYVPRRSLVEIDKCRSVVNGDQQGVLRGMRIDAAQQRDKKIEKILKK